MTRWKKEIAAVMGLPKAVALYKLRRSDGWRDRATLDRLGDGGNPKAFDVIFSRADATQAFNADAIAQLGRHLGRPGGRGP